MALSTRKRAAIAALVAGLNKQETAEVIGIRPGSVSRYFQDPLFVAALREAQDQALSGVAREMTAGAGDMLQVLHTIATSLGMPPAVRVRAALGWLGAMWKAVELHELTARLAELEARVGEVKP